MQSARPTVGDWKQANKEREPRGLTVGSRLLPAADALRAQLLALADLLPPLGSPTDPLTIVVRRGAARLRFEFRPEELAARHRDLSPMEQALLSVATDKPQTQAAMARQAGYKPRSVTAAFTSLVRKRLLLRTPDGYSAGASGGKLP